MMPPTDLPAVCPTLFGEGSARYLTPKGVAELLGVSVKTLERWRCQGAGPPFVQVSRKVIRYRSSDVHAFLEERVRTNTVA